MLIVRNEVIIGILSHLYLSFQLFEAPRGPGFMVPVMHC